MSNMKVGEYVRINGDFRIICIGIGKVVNKNKDTIYVEMSNNNLPISFNIDRIEKHLKNIIDLIEVGDYVNGKLVSNVDKVDNMNFIEWDDGDMYKTEITNDKFIESIVTREQFASMEYKIEAEE